MKPTITKQAKQVNSYLSEALSILDQYQIDYDIPDVIQVAKMVQIEANKNNSDYPQMGNILND